MHTILFRNGTLWSGARPAPRPGWLLVQGDRIARCGTANEPEPAAETTVDLEGGHLLPGFCDAHSHLGRRVAPAVEDGRVLRSADEALAAVRAAGRRESARRLDRLRARGPRPLDRRPRADGLRSGRGQRGGPCS
jgi:predicted amidohydrolase YtcJ